MKFRGKYSFLSNFHHIGSLQYNGLTYTTSEAAYQATICCHECASELDENGLFPEERSQAEIFLGR